MQQATVLAFFAHSWASFEQRGAAAVQQAFVPTEYSAPVQLLDCYPSWLRYPISSLVCACVMEVSHELNMDCTVWLLQWQSTERRVLGDLVYECKRLHPTRTFPRVVASQCVQHSFDAKLDTAMFGMAVGPWESQQLSSQLMAS